MLTAACCARLAALAGCTTDSRARRCCGHLLQPGSNGAIELEPRKFFCCSTRPIYGSTKRSFVTTKFDCNRGQQTCVRLRCQRTTARPSFAVSVNSSVVDRQTHALYAVPRKHRLLVAPVAVSSISDEDDGRNARRPGQSDFRLRTRRRRRITLNRKSAHGADRRCGRHEGYPVGS